MEEKRQKSRMFWLAFLLTLLLLAVIMIGTVIAVQPGMPGRVQQEEQYTYTPAPQDSLTMLLMGARGKGSDFVLLRYNPQYGQIPIAVLPKETRVLSSAGETTLDALLASQGPLAVKRALQTYLGVQIDRYAAIDENSFLQFLSRLTSVSFTLPQTFSYSRDGAGVRLEAGERRLDGRDVLDLQSAPELQSDPAQRSKLMGTLYAQMINTNLDAFGEPLCEQLFKMAVNMMDTDLNAADFELRRESADFLSRVKATVSAGIVIEGENVPNVGFRLSEESKTQIQRYYTLLTE